MMVKEKGVRINTDFVAVHLWNTLYEDFSLGSIFSKASDALNTGDMVSYRTELVRECGFIPPHRFKQIQQLLNLHKRYRFSKDAYSPEQLEDLTNQKYLTNQVILSSRRFQPRTLRSFLVLQEARRICRAILGPLDRDEVALLHKFGKKSSIGCPLRLAYIDHKLTDERAFTGSAECADWFFKEYVPKDPVLDRIVKRIGIKPGHKSLRQVHLVLENVPKTWKVHRSITPLALLDLFYTYGVGRVVQKRLKEFGLDIRHLQDRHRRMIQKFSVSLTHATADMSAASDSISSDLLNAVLPRPWYNLVKACLVRQVKVGGKICFTESILPMGNGATFPLETLVFYSITKAIGTLSGIRGIYSVYGDDLVYPSRLHPFVSRVFPEIGLTLNLDKTFVSFPFRESCGEDFYRGFPVRSFFLRNEDNCILSGAKAEAYLYKVINGLRRRWDDTEIPHTLAWLLQQVSMCRLNVLRVPPNFPDTAGIKVDNPNHHVLGSYWVPYEPITVKFCDGSRWYQFSYLRTVAKKRVILDQEPYYWQKLSGDDDVVSSEFSEKFNIYTEVPTQAISWKKVTRRRSFRITGNRLRVKYTVKYIPLVASRVIEQYHIQKNRIGSCSDWI